VKLHANLAEMGEAFHGQLGRLRALRESLERRNAELRRVAIGDGKNLRLVPGDHDRSVVPGPDEIQ
jgi:hypothetical protein